MGHKLSEYGVKFITTEESFAARAYNKDGHWTIGYGHTGSDVKEGDTVTRENAVEIFVGDAMSVTNHIDTYTNNTLSQCQVDALTSLLFNCGVGLLGSAHTVGHALQFGTLNDVADAILMYDMATINGVRGPFLASRRKAEHDMFLGASEVTTPSGVFKCAPSN